ncbi:MAG: hypothetical protein E5299_01254 [Burkholderia gladioli]|nr:MAG: hypothetical protein E5299_01254 [Burkholderia gladioli]
MALTGIISGDTNTLRTTEVRHAVDYAASQAISFACESA